MAKAVKAWQKDLVPAALWGLSYFAVHMAAWFIFPDGDSFVDRAGMIACFAVVVAGMSAYLLRLGVDHAFFPYGSICLLYANPVADALSGAYFDGNTNVNNCLFLGLSSPFLFLAFRQLFRTWRELKRELEQLRAEEAQGA